jgi:hypothetical protein
MANALQDKVVATAAPGPQNVSITDGQATTSIQAPTSTGNIWFAFEIGSGSANLNVNFNGNNYPNIPPGQYQLSGLSTPLGLTVKVNGSAKLAWVAN